ncbi:di-trans,poly-cis-decaprenylcistransferase [Bordetella pertussis]|nr:di-trans,poly-cis-decaprenylcistransferase [Bordetella pertussis]AMG88853.2 di-trans,poly-cis-decaprenylcistransferase [Bordetella bronchiseptica]AUL42723.1 di-trans,poly-cis-decaprenylcistransferase [Bordetella parapertussis]ETA64969.1 di-trans,poly-cis-decaprenylcistransferase [Bordetella pertussis CHLA-11]ETH00470.1 di-trans,poly-cis-decaprenylcistransferase [Bordetella pertussis 2250905]ETH04368.1 di-trans,poly-cis-decaprenylcistransferase [Bordetella pertussis 2356847]ETH09188.1 di-tr
MSISESVPYAPSRPRWSCRIWRRRDGAGFCNTFLLAALRQAPAMALSSTQAIPETGDIPRHVAIIMDGNGRWATRRHLPRTAGHAKGVHAVRRVVEACGRRGVRYLTLFAFSSENWRRPADEVSLLMRLFVQALEREVDKLQDQGVRLHVVGDLSAFEPKLQELIAQAQERTEHNDRLHLTVAANYGGRWDILQATRAMLRADPGLAQDPDRIDEARLAEHLSMAWAPEPDLFIRTGGEQRISNFLVWQLAYAEFYFTEQFWPDFGADELDAAFEWYRTRERRFGRTSAQLRGGAKR